jgi:hypothetical protein
MQIVHMRLDISPGCASGVEPLSNDEISGSTPLDLVLPSGDVGKNDVETASDKVLPEKAVEGA